MVISGESLIISFIGLLINGVINDELGIGFDFAVSGFANTSFASILSVGRQYSGEHSRETSEQSLLPFNGLQFFCTNLKR
jgi:hypothetical protein